MGGREWFSCGPGRFTRDTQHTGNTGILHGLRWDTKHSGTAQHSRAVRNMVQDCASEIRATPSTVQLCRPPRPGISISTRGSVNFGNACSSERLGQNHPCVHEYLGTSPLKIQQTSKIVPVHLPIGMIKVNLNSGGSPIGARVEAAL
jgi:hypothetical protein